MRNVKLLRVVEEIVPCERDHIAVRYMDSDWSRLPDTGEMINSEVSYKENIIPITHFCERSTYPLEGFKLEKRYDNPEKIYSKDTYIAVDYENSQYLKNWINNQNKELSKKVENLQSVNLKWIGKYNDVKEVVRDATFWQRLKWLFTGVKVNS